MVILTQQKEKAAYLSEAVAVAGKCTFSGLVVADSDVLLLNNE